MTSCLHLLPPSSLCPSLLCGAPFPGPGFSSLGHTHLQTPEPISNALILELPPQPELFYFLAVMLPISPFTLYVFHIACASFSIHWCQMIIFNFFLLSSNWLYLTSLSGTGKLTFNETAEALRWQLHVLHQPINNWTLACHGRGRGDSSACTHSLLSPSSFPPQGTSALWVCYGPALS